MWWESLHGDDWEPRRRNDPSRPCIDALMEIADNLLGSPCAGRFEIDESCNSISLKLLLIGPRTAAASPICHFGF